MKKFFAEGKLAALDRWLKENSSHLPEVDPPIRLGPLVSRPSKIACIGLNFSDHAAESGADIPKEPVVFFKSTTALCGPNDDVVIPWKAENLDWEVELAVIIGKKAGYVSRENALEFVAGYALHNDYSESSFQLERGGQWSYLSEFMTLLPGDVISTGTPAGVGLGSKPPTYLKVGDIVTLGIEGLGESRQNVVPWKSK